MEFAHTLHLLVLARLNLPEPDLNRIYAMFGSVYVWSHVIEAIYHAASNWVGRRVPISDMHMHVSGVRCANRPRPHCVRERLFRADGPCRWPSLFGTDGRVDFDADALSNARLHGTLTFENLQ